METQRGKKKSSDFYIQADEHHDDGNAMLLWLQAFIIDPQIGEFWQSHPSYTPNLRPIVKK